MRYATDRAVQHRGNYTVGIAMSSIRIGPYECVNGCNRYGWHTGDGMVYVYNDTTKYYYDQYGGTFQRFANMYRVPGTTEEDATLRQPWSERAPYFTGMTYTHNEAAGKDEWKQDYDEDGTKACSFVGGAELNREYITAAMEFEAYSWTEEESRQELIKIHNSAQPDEYAERNKMKQVLVSDLSAKKSYFLFDDEIVCVGSDIDFSTRDNGVNTYVDNRQLRETSVSGGQTVYGTDDVVVDGIMLEKTNGFSEPKSYYAFTLDALLAAELRTVVSVQIFAGQIPVSCTLEYSAYTYGNNKTGALAELCKALFAYSDSAKAYFSGD